MLKRLILLRRPPVLSFADGPFVPPQALLDKVDQRWVALLQGNPAYFDGRLLHVLGVHRNGCGGAVIHVMDCAYRLHAVNDADFDTGARPLGVKGITLIGDRILLGRRAANVSAYAGEWEFAPGGAVEPDVSPAQTIARELAEETGLSPQREPCAIALLYDPVIRTWELVFRIDVAASPTRRTPEYSEIELFEIDALPRPLTPAATQMIPLARAVCGGEPTPRGC